MLWDLRVALRRMRTAANTAIDPRVAHRAMRMARGDETAVDDIALALSPAQLAGRVALPDPLPAIRLAEDEGLSALNTAERRVLLFAALSLSRRTSDLLEAAAVDIDVLLFGALRPLLSLEDGHVEIRDERTRSWIVDDADEAEIWAAHGALARIARRRGEQGAEAWHRAHARPAEPVASAALLAFASARLSRGDAGTAQRIACLATASSDREAASRAWALAGLSAFWSGETDDAREGLVRATSLHGSRLENSVRAARDALEALQNGPRGEIFDRDEAATIFRDLTAATVGSADREAMTQLSAVADAVYEDPRRADSLQARLFLSVGSATDGRHRLSPHAEAQVTMMQVAFLSQAGDRSRAARLLFDAIPRLPLSLPAAGVVSSFVHLLSEAHPGLDESIAAAYDEMRDHRVLRYDGDGSALGHGPEVGTRASAAADLSRTMPSVLPAPTAEEPLSARQRQVLALLVRGLTNRDIADRLGLSPRTVEVHVGHILRKYRVRSRSALLALLVDPGESELALG